MATTTTKVIIFKPHLLFPSFPKPKLYPHPSLSKPISTTLIKMSSSSSQIIEHIVLFKTKPETEPNRIDAMLNNLNSLKSLEQVLHITSGALARTRSSPFPFTHILHSRYKSIQELEAYSAHPRHVSVVTDFVKPICDDIMAFDWVARDLSGEIEIRPGSGMRVNLVKLKEGVGESVKNEVLEVIGGIKEKFGGGGGIEQLSFGESVSPARAKGFSIGSIAVVNGLGGLEGLDSEGANEEKAKVRGFIESVIVLDYLVPQVQNASL